jgi:IMP dehydrogenase
MADFSKKIVGEGITFDDVLLLPEKSDVVPRDVSTETIFSRNIPLMIPIASAAMDTVTESRLAIALAQEGGIGIIHKSLSAEKQAQEVAKVKRFESGVIADPIILSPNETVSQARQTMAQYGISGLPIVEDDKLVGILTNRDLRLYEGPECKVKEIMTTKLITAPEGTPLVKAREILHKNKVEKLLLVDDNFALRGLITMKDILKAEEFPSAAKDVQGRLRVGAAVGVYDYERVEKLIAGAVDVIVVDTAHGHSTKVIETAKEIKRRSDVEVVAGNVATAQATKDLIEAGADGIKVGIGPGSICTTRIISGVGVPQVTALFECSQAAAGSGVPIIADGGIRRSGDITKAVAAGASSVMIGSLFAGAEESPSQTVIHRGRSYKIFRGMGSLGAMVEGASERYRQSGVHRDKLVPEGVEGRVPYKGPLSEVVYQLVGGLRAGMGYTGAASIKELQTKRFIRISHAGLLEGHPHDITITQEAPNYTLE